MRRLRRCVRSTALGLGVLALGGCAIGKLVGGMAQNVEYQKQIEVLPEYELEGHTVAVVALADMATLYEHPDLVPDVIGGVAGRIAKGGPRGQGHPPAFVLRLAAAHAAVGRVAVRRDRQAPRLRPGDLSSTSTSIACTHQATGGSGEGVCLATVSMIEADGPDPDMFADSYTINVSFPKEKGVGPDGANQSQIEMGLRSELVKQISWLFYTHLEPKYPRQVPSRAREGPALMGRTGYGRLLLALAAVIVSAIAAGGLQHPRSRGLPGPRAGQDRRAVRARGPSDRHLHR